MIEKEEINRVKNLVNSKSFLGLTLKSNLTKAKLEILQLQDEKMILFDRITEFYLESRNLKMDIIEKDLKLKRLETFDKLLDLEDLLLSEGHDIRYEELLLNLTNQMDDISLFQIFDYIKRKQCT